MNTVSILVTVVIINWNFRGPRTHRYVPRRSRLLAVQLSIPFQDAIVDPFSVPELSTGYVINETAS